ncbi:MAG: hypothetical protein ACREBU_24310 [Nitrososphaera sp.]
MSQPNRQARPPRIAISSQLRDQMMIHVRDGINHKIDAITKFIDITGYEQICGGLYTYAVEEFGKLLVLKQGTRLPNGDFEIDYKNGFLHHPTKFELAEGVLPNDCFEISGGSYSRQSYSRDSYMVPTAADFETRLTIFNSDFDHSLTRIQQPPRVNIALLKNALTIFKQFLSTYPVP